MDLLVVKKELSAFKSDFDSLQTENTNLIATLHDLKSDLAAQIEDTKRCNDEHEIEQNTLLERLANSIVEMNTLLAKNQSLEASVLSIQHDLRLALQPTNVEGTKPDNKESKPDLPRTTSDGPIPSTLPTDSPNQRGTGSSNSNERKVIGIAAGVYTGLSRIEWLGVRYVLMLLG
jgi:hypothetical protein